MRHPWMGRLSQIVIAISFDQTCNTNNSNMVKKKNENTTSIGFEEVIWRAADKLRGNLNASEYEGVVLGLIFLKYINDNGYWYGNVC